MPSHLRELRPGHEMRHRPEDPLDRVTIMLGERLERGANDGIHRDR